MVYEYECEQCSKTIDVEVVSKHYKCPFCGKGKMLRKFSAPAVTFKGDGWAKKEK